MSEFKEITIPGIFQNRAAKLKEKPCVYTKTEGAYESISWDEMSRMIHSLGRYLLSMGVQKGDRIGLFSPNRYEWWVADQAILSTGAVNVPIYSSNTVEEVTYILKDSGCRICIVSSQEHLEKVKAARKSLDDLEGILVFDEPERHSKNKNICSLSEAMAAGERYESDGAVDEIIRAIQPEDLATIMYTSGTTGNPKGVMLTHSNFVADVINTLENVDDLISSEDIALSFLPLSHVLERTAGYYGPVYAGAAVAFTENMTTIMENFTEVRPTFIICVPRIYERIRAAILSRVTEASFVKKFLFNQASKAARKNLPYVCSRKKRGFFFNLRFSLMDRLVFSKMKKTLGMDRLRYAVSGGGPLSVSDAEFFIGMGIEILEGYGLTETSPITNCNQPGSIRPGTVGRAIPETEIKISDQGEILVKGPQVMQGYYNLPEGTAETFTKDGFFKTGDLGMVDADGYLTITGRIKDIIITAGGKNISPQNIENSVKQSVYIEQIAIIGDRRKYLSALVVPSLAEVGKWARLKGISFTSNSDLVESGEVNQLIKGEIDCFSEQFARVEQIKKFKLLDAEWTLETGELTGKQSVKRRVIEEKYSDLIEEMYPKEESLAGR